MENSRDEEQKSKKAMESLASALHEVSAEATETKAQPTNHPTILKVHKNIIINN